MMLYVESIIRLEKREKDFIIKMQNKRKKQTKKIK